MTPLQCDVPCTLAPSLQWTLSCIPLNLSLHLSLHLPFSSLKQLSSFSALLPSPPVSGTLPCSCHCLAHTCAPHALLPASIGWSSSAYASHQHCTPSHSFHPHVSTPSPPYSCTHRKSLYICPYASRVLPLRGSWWRLSRVLGGSRGGSSHLYRWRRLQEWAVHSRRW